MTENAKYAEVPVAETGADHHADGEDRDNTETAAANRDANETDDQNTDEVVSEQPAANNETNETKRKNKLSKERKRKSAWEESGGNKFRNDESCYVYVCTNLCGLCLAYACCECFAEVY